MVEPQYTLSPRDRELVKRVSSIVLRSQRNESYREEADPVPQAPDMYYALAPCGERIPGGTPKLPGKWLCCLFMYGRKNPEDPDDMTKELQPLRTPDDKNVREWVYNPWPTTITGCEYIAVRRTKDGTWLCDKPVGVSNCYEDEFGGAVSMDDAMRACHGKKCTQEWTGNNWTITSGCDDTSTSSSSSSSSPTTSESPSTSAGPTTTCACPTTEGPTTSPDPSTTEAPTTTGACKCLPPTFCGENVGDCTVTYCSTAEAEETECETTTSTTSESPSTSAGPTTTGGGSGPGGCNCDEYNSTSTPNPNPPPACSGCAVYGDPYGNLRVVDNCDNSLGCFCPAMNTEVGPCGRASYDCVIVPPTTTPRPANYCIGECVVLCFGEGWTSIAVGCQARGPCGCAVPVDEPCPCGTVAVVKCAVPPGGPPGGSEPPPPTTCPPDDCQCLCKPAPPTDPPTSTTEGPTTTQPGCEKKCRFKPKPETDFEEATTDDWDKVDDPCPEECPCGNPGRKPTAECDTEVTRCGSLPTTTAAPTTTPPPYQAICCGTMAGGGPTVCGGIRTVQWDDGPFEACPEFEGGSVTVYDAVGFGSDSAAACAALCPGATTTLAPTTTPTPTTTPEPTTTPTPTTTESPTTTPPAKNHIASCCYEIDVGVWACANYCLGGGEGCAWADASEAETACLGFTSAIWRPGLACAGSGSDPVWTNGPIPDGDTCGPTTTGPVGACCTGGGGCVEVDAVSCAGLGGTWLGAGEGCSGCG